MEVIDDIRGDVHGEHSEHDGQQANSTSDRLAGLTNEEHSSAFRALKPFAASSNKMISALPQPPILSPLPFLPISSPSLYSSLLSSLYRTGTRHNNNREQDMEGKKENKEAEGKFLAF